MLSGNTSEAGYSCGGPDKSCLFLLTNLLTSESDCPERRLAGWQRRLLFDCFSALSTLLETLAACFIRTSGRTHHRIRSPRLEASSR
jgi:hypothetical protein